MPPSAETLDPLTVETVLGREVRSVADENMSRIVDVIVIHSGQVRADVIDFGGFLGVVCVGGLNQPCTGARRSRASRRRV